MKRRQFIALLGSAAIAPMARAQQSKPVIGLLSGTNREDRLLGAIWKGLNEAGFVEGENAAMEYRFAQGRFEQLPALAKELVDRHVAAIIGIQSAAAPLAAKAATATIPIVFSIGGDPVKLGLVKSLSRPEGNVTGATFLVNTLSAKRIELAHELVPSAKAVGLLVNPKNPASPPELADAQGAARTLGVALEVRNASSPDDIDAAFVHFAERQIGVVTFAADATFNAARRRLIALAAQHRLGIVELSRQYKFPTIFFERESVAAGGLMSYAASFTDSFRQVGVYVGRVLKGEKPTDLPVLQPTKFELVINLKTAKALGIEMPDRLIALADEVIE